MRNILPIIIVVVSFVIFSSYSKACEPTESVIKNLTTNLINQSTLAKRQKIFVSPGNLSYKSGTHLTLSANASTLSADYYVRPPHGAGGPYEYSAYIEVTNDSRCAVVNFSFTGR